MHREVGATGPTASCIVDAPCRAAGWVPVWSWGWALPSPISRDRVDYTYLEKIRSKTTFTVMGARRLAPAAPPTNTQIHECMWKILTRIGNCYLFLILTLIFFVQSYILARSLDEDGKVADLSRVYKLLKSV